MGNGIQLIWNERLRQEEQEGWTEEHDDQWTDGELGMAAASYVFAHTPEDIEELSGTMDTTLPPFTWPFDYSWWKPSPKDRIKELSKAGALIAAEIDRLLRIK